MMYMIYTVNKTRALALGTARCEGLDDNRTTK